MKYLSKILGIMALVYCASLVAGAQEITGTITDPSGAIVPNATVTVTNRGTGISRSTVSGPAGLYDLPGLEVGTYDMKVAAKGFKTFTTSGLVLNVTQTLRASIPLEIGAETQTVTVEADALQVQSETNEVSSLITGKQIEQLATN